MEVARVGAGTVVGGVVLVVVVDVVDVVVVVEVDVVVVVDVVVEVVVDVVVVDVVVVVGGTQDTATNVVLTLKGLARMVMMFGLSVPMTTFGLIVTATRRKLMTGGGGSVPTIRTVYVAPGAKPAGAQRGKDVLPPSNPPVPFCMKTSSGPLTTPAGPLRVPFTV